VVATAFAMLGPLVLVHGDDLHAQPVRASSVTRPHPDVVLILTDDQSTNSLMGMSSVRRLLVDQGRRYTEMTVANPLCCPSRSTILTGLFSHHTGVWRNFGSHGGWPAFVGNGNEQRTVAVALQRAGYRTGLIGKYLNNFDSSPFHYVPPGWSRFEAFRDVPFSGAYYDYRLGNDPKVFGSDEEDYSTDVLSTRAVNFIWSTPQPRSLFLYFAPYAPHSPSSPAPRDIGSLDGKLASFHPKSVRAPVDDKPAYIRRRRQVRQDVIDRVRQERRESLMAVDDAVAAIVAALEHSGRLQDTMLIFMSDNGFLTGQHRLIGKTVPYRGATSVPLVIRWDGRVPAGRIDRKLASNADIAATIAEAAGVSMATDGASLLGAVRRTGTVLEATDHAKIRRPAYCGWRTKWWMYVRYASGEEELYSYRRDRQELHNLAADPRYAQRVQSMKAQAKASCRPTPPGFHW
jgi:N-acetylglucosamine-6-sulfatase